MTHLIIIFCICLLLERAFPAMRLPAVDGWMRRALVLNFSAILIMLVAANTWTPFFKIHPQTDLLRQMPYFAGGLTAFFAFQFIQYWWHLARHRSQFLWNNVHQLHHSAQRIEALTASYAHPLDTACNMFLSSALLWVVLGLPWQAVAWFSVIEGAYDYFTHMNIKTPHWLGYLVQRPEMHRIHHESDSHQYNYSLPVFDMLFGTHRNPRHGQPINCGFDADREQMVWPMLLGRDVHSQPKDAA